MRSDLTQRLHDVAPTPLAPLNFDAVLVRSARLGRRRAITASALAVTILALGSWAVSAFEAPAVPPRDVEPVASPSSNTYRSEEDRFRVLVPKGWFISDEPLTDIAEPRDIATLATFPLRPGGACAPNRAIKEMGRDDALIFVMEYSGPRGGPWPQRPRRIEPSKRPPVAYECWLRSTNLIRFRDAGRYLQIHVALGVVEHQARDTAPEKVRRQAYRILNSFRFSPR